MKSFLHMLPYHPSVRENREITKRSQAALCVLSFSVAYGKWAEAVHFFNRSKQ